MSTEVQTPVKVDTAVEKTAKRPKDAKKTVNLAGGLGVGRHKFNRKRSQSYAGNKGVFIPHKKRKKEGAVLPTKFLLGGNIRDPLNLNSLQDEEVNRAMNAVTPESSPMPTPQHRKGEIEVIIPANIRDPLSLAGEEDNDAYAASFRTTTLKRVRKKNKKKKPRSSTGSGREDNAEFKSDESKGEEGIEPDLKRLKEDESVCSNSVPVEGDKRVSKEADPPVQKPHVLDLSAKDPLRRTSRGSEGGAGGSAEKIKPNRKLFNGKDKIVSPVIPQPGAWIDRHAPHRFRKQEQLRPVLKTPKFKEKDKKFQYGNYNRYYGYRYPGQEVDLRLKMLSRVDNLFSDKDVLDIGCNTGNVTISVARDLGAKKVVGIDIDRTLVEMARSNLRKLSRSQGKTKFPVSMPLVYGSLDVPGLPNANHFPHNLSFIQGNYVLENDVLLELEKPQFDVILALSVTKWFHLNWGDSGLKRVFHRIFRQLRPGGKLVLEAQAYSSYKRKKSLTETTWRNYQSIKLLPNMFSEYLLSEVGFSKCEVIGSPYHPSKGFQRPIRIFTKSIGSPSSVEKSSSTMICDGLECSTPDRPRNDEMPIGPPRSDEASRDLPRSDETSRDPPRSDEMSVGPPQNDLSVGLLRNSSSVGRPQNDDSSVGPPRNDDSPTDRFSAADLRSDTSAPLVKPKP
ncbi:methyltransferase activity [Nesidiocoris tenuis]|uniref:RNA methyltransferase n=1 Tax=Nesidiocoris tenuis TaxID=355587 RepID=A0ABN7AY28_9HEMI|nr:methyltransferase activity [Nesidiocoris tenuis]